MVKEGKYKNLRSLLTDYEEDGLTARNEKRFLEILESLDNSAHYSLKNDLSKKEKKLFVCLLKDFGGMENDPWVDVPGGKAIEYGLGSKVLILIGQLIPRWKRPIMSSIDFCISCLICGFLSKWLLHRFSVGVFITILIIGVKTTVFQLIKWAIAIYYQNELLLKRRSASKRKRPALEAE